MADGINKKNLEVGIDLNTSEVQKQTKIIQKSFQGIAQQLQSIQKVLGGVGKSTTLSLGKVSKETKNIDKNIKSADKYTKSWNKSLLKVGASVAIFRRIGKEIANIVKESGSWIENLNLFEVTFGKSYQKYLDWSVDFAKNLGFATNELVKFTGLFKQLSTSIGVAGQVGDELAQTLTQVGVDLTSFYNLKDIMTAMQKLQAGIFAGQTKPLNISGTIKRFLVKKLCEPTYVGCEQYKIAC